MIKKKRHNSIMEVLIKQGSVSVNELAEQLNVSTVTIRKDLNELEQANRKRPTGFIAAMARLFTSTLSPSIAR